MVPVNNGEKGRAVIVWRTWQAGLLSNLGSGVTRICHIHVLASAIQQVLKQ
jgi:hypothetical protein